MHKGRERLLGSADEECGQPLAFVAKTFFLHLGKERFGHVNLKNDPTVT